MIQNEQDLKHSAYTRSVGHFVTEPWVQGTPGKVRKATVVATRADINPWGWLPALSLVSACGLLLIALGNAAALAGSPDAGMGFWAGLLILLAPTATRLIALEPSRRERIGLVLLLGMGLYLVKVMHSPFAFTFADEFFHLQNANAILASHHLFNQNSILPASTFYPGLETLTTALVSLSGLSVFTAGLLVIGVARLLLFLGIYLFTEQVSRSARVAAIATLFYMCHSNFLFWSAQFSYESLSLPLLVTVLVIVAWRQEHLQIASYNGLTLLALLGIGAIIVTHHLSSYFLVAFLLLWSAFHFRLHRFFWRNVRAFLYKNEGKSNEGQNEEGPGPQFALLPTERAGFWQKLRTGVRHRQYGPLDLACVALIAVLLWLIFVADSTVGYLSPVLKRALLSIANVLVGQEGTRELFHSSSGQIAPLWERVTGLSSVFLSFAGLPLGLWLFWRRYRHHALALVLATLAVGYFGMLGLRLTPAGWETGNRSSAYLFIGLAFILAIGFVEFWLPLRVTWRMRVGFAAYVAIIFMGGIIAGWPPTLRVAQPYLVQTQSQIIEPQGLTVAQWTHAKLGANNVIVADNSNAGFLLAYGGQAALVDRKFRVDQILRLPGLDNSQIANIKTYKIRYVLMDRRQISQDNMAGYYFNRPDNTGVPSAAWLEPEVYEKFDHIPTVSRILDSGNIVLYDVGALANDAAD